MANYGLFLKQQKVTPMSSDGHVFIATDEPAFINDGKKPVHYKVVFARASQKLTMDRRQIELCEQILKTNVLLTNSLQGILGTQLADELGKADSPVRQFFDHAQTVRGEAAVLPADYLTEQRQQFADAKKSLRPLRS